MEPNHTEHNKGEVENMSLLYAVLSDEICFDQVEHTFLELWLKLLTFILSAFTIILSQAMHVFPLKIYNRNNWGLSDLLKEQK